VKVTWLEVGPPAQAGWAVLCVAQTPPGTNSCMEACRGLHARHSKSSVQDATAAHAIILDQDEMLTERLSLLCSCLLKGSTQVTQEPGLFCTCCDKLS